MRSEKHPVAIEALSDSAAGSNPSSNRSGTRSHKALRLLLVDCMPVVQHGIEAAVHEAAHVELVGTTGDHEQLLALVGKLRPDILLLDILSRARGSRSMRVQADIVRKVRRVNPETRCLVLTHFHPRHIVETLLEQGAVGVWSKFDEITDLLEALQSLHSGHKTRLLSPAVQAVLRSVDTAARETGWLALLTTREREVLKLVLDGEDSYQIGERLGISPRTVSTHRSRILQKTNARSFFELIGCLQQLEELGH